MMSHARAQCRMADTMFLPTPNIEIAVGSRKILRGAIPPWLATAAYALRSHSCRRGNVSCPENCGRYEGSESRPLSIGTFKLEGPTSIATYGLAVTSSLALIGTFFAPSRG